MFPIEFIRRVLYQAFSFQPNKPTDIYLESMDASDLTIDQYNQLEEFLLKNNYITQSAELNFFKLAPKGEALVYND